MTEYLFEGNKRTCCFNVRNFYLSYSSVFLQVYRIFGKPEMVFFWYFICNHVSNIIYIVCVYVFGIFEFLLIFWQFFNRFWLGV